MKSVLRPLVPSVAALLLLESIRAEAVIYFHAMPYRSAANSPFAQGIGAGTIYLETFEDGELNTPLVTGWNGGLQERPGTLSVDADDGVIDGKGQGYAWTRMGSVGSSGTKLPRGLHFDFSPNAEGKLPEFAGGVLFGAIEGLPDGVVFYEAMLAYDAEGVEITNGTWQVPIPEVSVPGTNEFSSDYARFVGIYVPGGISRIVFSNSGWVDHLQYGYAVPEPSAVTLALVLGAGALTRRQR